MAEKQTEQNAQKVYGSVYVVRTAKTKEGKEYELRVPQYQIQFNMEAVAEMQADKNGMLRFSIHERRDADKLAEEKKPTHYIVENTWHKDKTIDIYSYKDFTISKEELSKLTKEEEIGDKKYQKAYVNINSDGSLVSSSKRYEKAETITGKAFEVDRVERQLKAAKERMGEKEVSLESVGVAWKMQGKEKPYYSLCLNNDKVKYLPMDDDGKLHLALREMKEKKSESAPSHVVVMETAFLNGRLDENAEVEFTVQKSDVMKMSIEEKTSINEKEFVRQNAYINITEEGHVIANAKKYEGMEKKPILYGAKAETVDQQARKAEIERRIEIAKAKKEATEEKPEQKEKKVKKATAEKKPEQRKGRGI